MMIMSLLSFSTKFNYFFCALLTLELMALINLLYLVYSLKMYFYMSLSLYYTIFSVCEGCLGISLLVFMIRNFGNDYMYLYTLI